MAGQHKGNPYHLVKPSPWPIIGAIAAFLLTSGTILMVRDITIAVVIAGVILTLFTMGGWWYDVIQEAKNGTFSRGQARFSLWHGYVYYLRSHVFRGVFSGPI